MRAHLEFVMENISDDAIFVYEIGHPGNPQTEPPGDVVETGDILAGVGNQGEREGETGAKPPVAVSAVGANADQVRSVLSDGFVCVTEALRLAVSARCKVLQVEIEDCGPITTPLGEVELLAIVAERLEVGGYGAWLQHSPVHT